MAEKGAIMNAVRESVWPLITDGRIRPLVAKTFPLDQVRAAHQYFDSGRPRGQDPAGHVAAQAAAPDKYSVLLRGGHVG